jgi:predicted ATPase/DNA-binding SARP family transcriptional activator
VPAAAAALRGLPTPPRPSSLPTALTTLIGREREIDDLEPLLSRRRLVTLIGPGGGGKTRLALEVAHRHPGTVAWVELSPVGDPNLIAHQVLSALGGRSAGQTLAIESVIKLLEAGRCLLVLDNCEHLIEGCALFARAVLHGTTTTSILATSREALGVAGEHVWPVPPLSLPDAARALSDSSEAVALFVERARAVSPRFALDHRNAGAVAEICRRLDGLPLAIELAAARVRALTPEEIARRIGASFKLLASADRAVDPRHRTLEATIGWSFDLLGDEERRLLVRLAVFAGSFTIEAAERICACEGLPAERVLDLLMALVDRSLVQAEPLGEDARYRLLETVRQYAWERLDSAQANELRELHARTFLELAEEAAPHLFGGAASTEWVGRLEADVANLRAALEWALHDPARVDVALRLVAALAWFWFARGSLREGRRAMVRALNMSSSGTPAARAHAAISLGHMAIWQSDDEAVRASMEEGAALLQGIEGDDFWRTYALCGLAIACILEGELEGTMPLLDEAVAAARQRHHAVLPYALFWRARVLGALGETERGLADTDEMLSISRAQDYRPAVAHCLNVAGALLLRAGRPEEAADRLDESLAIHLENRDQLGIARVLEDLARLAARRDEHERAVLFHVAAENLREEIGMPRATLESKRADAFLAACREGLSATDYDRAREQAANLELQQIAAFARDWTAIEESEERVTAMAGEVAAAEAPAGVATADRQDGPAEEPLAILDIRALGATEVRLEGALVEGLWGRPKELLVLLAWHTEGLRREDVGLALWPDASPDKLRNLFHVTLHRLRKCMGARDWVVREGERYRLTQAIPWQLDARRFESAVSDALRRMRRAGDGAEALGAALDLYRGDFLHGESAGDWHFEIKEKLEELWLDANRALAQTSVQSGRDDEAAAALRRLVEHDPVDEEASRALILCALRRGERGEALREYKRLERALEDELGVEPGPETAALYKQLRRSG